MIPRRLDKYLADATPLSRSDIEAAWQEDRIDIEPAVEASPDEYALQTLIFEDDVVMLDGEPVTPVEPSHYIALHKPAGVLSTTDNPQGRRCLKRWLAELPDSIFPVGRLDKPTTGFLLLTDDGDLCFCLLRPRFHIEKEYHLTVRGLVTPDDERLEALQEGIDIGDRKPPVAALRTNVVDASSERSLLSVVVDEGRHRMVRRMARRADLDLRHLHRPRIGPIELGTIGAGETRRLTDEEVESLWEACGGRGASRRRQIAALRRKADRWRTQRRPHERLERWLAHPSNRCAAPKPDDLP